MRPSFLRSAHFAHLFPPAAPGTMPRAALCEKKDGGYTLPGGVYRLMHTFFCSCAYRYARRVPPGAGTFPAVCRGRRYGFGAYKGNERRQAPESGAAIPSDRHHAGYGGAEIR